jgi:hypothetical protein
MGANRSPATASRHDRWLRAGLVVSLAFAGGMHLVLAPDHFADSTLMGSGFVMAGIAELALALAVLMTPVRLVFAAIVAIAVALISLYTYNVMVGLPFAAADQHAANGTEHENAEAGHGSGHDEGLQLGAGEPIDLAGGITKSAEVLAVGLAVAQLLRDRRHRESTPPTS